MFPDDSTVAPSSKTMAPPSAAYIPTVKPAFTDAFSATVKFAPPTELTVISPSSAVASRSPTEMSLFVVNMTDFAVPPTTAISLPSLDSDTSPEPESASVVVETVPPLCVTSPFLSVRPVEASLSEIVPPFWVTAPSIVVAVTEPSVVSEAASIVAASSEPAASGSAAAATVTALSEAENLPSAAVAVTVAPAAISASDLSV